MIPADLNEPEKLLWQAFPHGTWVDLRAGDPVDDDLGSAVNWGPGRVIRAEVIRALLLGAGEVEPGTAKLVTVKGRDIGVFNVKGEYFALANRCPHAGGTLCQGTITGLALSDGPGKYRLLRPGEFIRCPWHGWEFDIRTGQSYCDPKSTRARQFKVTVETGEDLVKGPYVAETFQVSVENEYVVIEV